MKSGDTIHNGSNGDEVETKIGDDLVDVRGVKSQPTVVQPL